MGSDVRIENHGSIVLLVPLSEIAIEWVNEHIGEDNGYQPYWPTVYWPTVVAEPRDVEAVVNGMQEDGLVCE